MWSQYCWSSDHILSSKDLEEWWITYCTNFLTTFCIIISQIMYVTYLLIKIICYLIWNSNFAEDLVFSFFGPAGGRPSLVAQWWGLHLQCRSCWRCGFDPWLGEIPWRRKWRPTPVFLPGQSHRQRRLAVHGVAKCQTQLKWLSTELLWFFLFFVFCFAKTAMLPKRESSPRERDSAGE